MIRVHRGVTPKVAPSAYVDPSAQVIGDVEIGEESTIWCNTTLRGDVNSIRIGAGTSIQDNTVCHVDSHGRGYPLIVGNRVTVGHSVVLHGCILEDECLIGIGAILLNGAKVGKGAVVAAGALVPEEMEVPPGMVAMGVPAKVRREVTPEERERFRVNADNYITLGRVYREGQS
jgi:carbonic anhydrase/acetyltransferase-like protein (isoleucine patch superfamily)